VFNPSGRIRHPVLKAFVAFFKGFNSELVDPLTIGSLYRVAATQRGAMATKGLSLGVAHLEIGFMVCALLTTAPGGVLTTDEIVALLGENKPTVNHRALIGKGIVLMNDMGMLSCNRVESVSLGYGHERVTLKPWAEVMASQRIALLFMSLPGGDAGSLFWALNSKCQARLPVPIGFNMGRDVGLVEFVVRFRDFAHYVANRSGRPIPQLDKEQTRFMHFFGAVAQLHAVIRSYVGADDWLGQMDESFASFSTEGRTVLLASAPPVEPLEVTLYFAEACLQIWPASRYAGWAAGFESELRECHERWVQTVEAFANTAGNWRARRFAAHMAGTWEHNHPSDGTGALAAELLAARSEADRNLPGAGHPDPLPDYVEMYQAAKVAQGAGQLLAIELVRRVQDVPFFLAALLGSPSVLEGKGNSFGTLAEVMSNGLPPGLSSYETRHHGARLLFEDDVSKEYGVLCFLLVHAYETALVAAMRRDAILGFGGQVLRIEALVDTFASMEDATFTENRTEALQHACFRAYRFLRKYENMHVGIPTRLTLRGVLREVDVLARFVRFGRVGDGMPSVHVAGALDDAFTPVPDVYDQDLSGVRRLDEIRHRGEALGVALGRTLPLPVRAGIPRPMPDDRVMGDGLDFFQFPEVLDLEALAAINLMFRAEWRVRGRMDEFISSGAFAERKREYGNSNAGQCMDLAIDVATAYVGVAYHACVEVRLLGVDAELQVEGKLRRCAEAALGAVRSVTAFHRFFSSLNWGEAGRSIDAVLHVAMNGEEGAGVLPLAPEVVRRFRLPTQVHLPLNAGVVVPVLHVRWALLGKVQERTPFVEGIPFDWQNGWDEMSPEGRRSTRELFQAARQLGLEAPTPPASAPPEPAELVERAPHVRRAFEALAVPRAEQEEQVEMVPDNVVLAQVVAPTGWAPVPFLTIGGVVGTDGDVTDDAGVATQADLVFEAARDVDDPRQYPVARVTRRPPTRRAERTRAVGRAAPLRATEEESEDSDAISDGYTVSPDSEDIDGSDGGSSSESGSGTGSGTGSGSGGVSGGGLGGGQGGRSGGSGGGTEGSSFEDGSGGSDFFERRAMEDRARDEGPFVNATLEGLDERGCIPDGEAVGRHLPGMVVDVGPHDEGEAKPGGLTHTLEGSQTLKGEVAGVGTVADVIMEVAAIEATREFDGGIPQGPEKAVVVQAMMSAVQGSASGVERGEEQDSHARGRPRREEFTEFSEGIGQAQQARLRRVPLKDPFVGFEHGQSSGLGLRTGRIEEALQAGAAPRRQRAFQPPDPSEDTDTRRGTPFTTQQFMLSRRTEPSTDPFRRVVNTERMGERVWLWWRTPTPLCENFEGMAIPEELGRSFLGTPVPKQGWLSLQWPCLSGMKRTYGALCRATADHARGDAAFAMQLKVEEAVNLWLFGAEFVEEAVARYDSLSIDVSMDPNGRLRAVVTKIDALLGAFRRGEGTLPVRGDDMRLWPKQWYDDLLEVGRMIRATREKCSGWHQTGVRGPKDESVVQQVRKFQQAAFQVMRSIQLESAQVLAGEQTAKRVEAFAPALRNLARLEMSTAGAINIALSTEIQKRCAGLHSSVRECVGQVELMVALWLQVQNADEEFADVHEFRVEAISRTRVPLLLESLMTYFCVCFESWKRLEHTYPFAFAMHDYGLSPSWQPIATATLADWVPELLFPVVEEAVDAVNALQLAQPDQSVQIDWVNEAAGVLDIEERLRRSDLKVRQYVAFCTPAMCYLRAGDDEEAGAILARTVDVAPKPTPLTNWTGTLLQLGKVGVEIQSDGRTAVWTRPGPRARVASGTRRNDFNLAVALDPTVFWEMSFLSEPALEVRIESFRDMDCIRTALVRNRHAGMRLPACPSRNCLALAFVFGLDVMLFTIRGTVASFSLVPDNQQGLATVHEEVATIDLMTAMVPYVQWMDCVDIRAFQSLNARPNQMGRFVPIAEQWDPGVKAVRAVCGNQLWRHTRRSMAILLAAEMLIPHAVALRVGHFVQSYASRVPDGLEVWDVLFHSLMPNLPGWVWNLRTYAEVDRTLVVWFYPETANSFGMGEAAARCKRWNDSVWKLEDAPHWAAVCDYFLSVDRIQCEGDPRRLFTFSTPDGDFFPSHVIALGGAHWRELAVDPPFQHTAWDQARDLGLLHHDPDRWEVEWPHRRDSTFERVLLYCVRDGVIPVARRPLNIPYASRLVEGYDADAGWNGQTDARTQAHTAEMIANFSWLEARYAGR
jgi:hypothetical protein